MTTIILWVMHFIPGLRMRIDEESEIIGIDDAEMGEFAYDYVAVDAELGPKSDDGMDAMRAAGLEMGRGGAGNLEMEMMGAGDESHGHSMDREKMIP